MKGYKLYAEVWNDQPPLHTFLVNKWYFDELYDAGFVRPMATAGRFGRTVVESDFVQGFIVGGAVGVVRVGTSFARAIRTGSPNERAMLDVASPAAVRTRSLP